jgi:hypothetical protein
VGRDHTDEGETAQGVFAGRVRQGSSFQARLGSRPASAATDSGFRSGRAAVGGRPVAALRSGTANLVSGP